MIAMSGRANGEMSAYVTLFPAWTISVTAVANIIVSGAFYNVSGWVIADCSQANDFWFMYNKRDNTWEWQGATYYPSFTLDVFFNSNRGGKSLSLSSVKTVPGEQSPTALCIDFAGITNVSIGVPDHATAWASFTGIREEGSWGPLKISGSRQSSFALK
jgi:hypothetical protein